MSSLARTKLILATADRETATWCSDFIGHRQVRDMEEGYSYVTLGADLGNMRTGLIVAGALAFLPGRFMFEFFFG